MNVERKAKCENCANEDICKHNKPFIDGVEKIKSVATSMGRGTNITIECRYYSANEIKESEKG